MIPLDKTIISKEMMRAALDALSNEDLLFGESVTAFEEEFADYCGADYAVAVGSGTEALTFSLMAIGMEGKHAAVPPASYIATANVAFHAGGKPVFCDIGKDNNMDPGMLERLIRKDRKLKAIIPVHLHGYPAQMDDIMEIAEKRDIPVIEDACQAHGASYHGRKAGSIGKVGCFSFNPVKNMTVCGEGGMAITDDRKIAERIRMLADSGRRSPYTHKHDIIGFSSRINTMNAAIGRVQLAHLDGWNTKRRKAAAMYRKLLADVDAGLPPEQEGMEPVYNKFAIKVKERDMLQKHLNDKGIDCDAHYPIPIHLQAPYRRLGYRRGDFPAAESFAKETLSLPLFPGIRRKEIEEVCGAISDFI